MVIKQKFQNESEEVNQVAGLECDTEGQLPVTVKNISGMRFHFLMFG